MEKLSIIQTSCIVFHMKVTFLFYMKGKGLFGQVFLKSIEHVLAKIGTCSFTLIKAFVFHCIILWYNCCFFIPYLSLCF